MVVYLRAFSRSGYPEYNQFAGREIQRNEAVFTVSSGLKKEINLRFIKDYFSKK